MKGSRFVAGEGSGGWEVHISSRNEVVGYGEWNVFIFRRIDGGRYMECLVPVPLDEPVEETGQTCEFTLYRVESGDYFPGATFSIGSAIPNVDRHFQGIMEALGNALAEMGIRAVDPDTEARHEGELGALHSHLEDLRALVFSSDIMREGTDLFPVPPGQEDT